jgi:hypothetical protein
MTEKKITERVKDLTTVNFSITKCPQKVYEEFVAFCKEETNDNYSMGLRDLLNGMKSNIKEVVLYQQYMETKDELNQIRAELARMQTEMVPEQETETKPATFGKKETKKSK